MRSFTVFVPSQYPSKIQPWASSSRRWGNVQNGEQGSGPPKQRSEVLCRRLHGNEVVIAVSRTIPSRHRAAPRRMYVYLPPAWGSVSSDGLIPRFLQDYNQSINASCNSYLEHRPSTKHRHLHLVPV
jgi:hypothetical protein